MFGSSNRKIIQNPVENEWGELKRSCESEGSGEILDEGMVSDLLSGVL